MGGGTFDVSLLKLSDGIFKVIASGGDANLGGDDFDVMFAKSYLLENLKINFHELSEKDRLKISKKFKVIKEKLTNTKKVHEKLEIKGKLLEVVINIKDFDKSVESLIDKTISISSDLLNEIDIALEDISGFVLVGGSTRIKSISKKLKEKFKTEVFDDVDPDLVVSKGAALHGFELLNGSRNILLDVTPLSLGIETMGGLMEKVISRNTPIPAIKEQIFTTHENGQTALKIKILQGERETSDKNRCLGEFILSNLMPKPAGIPRIKIMFSLDADGILYVTAKEEESGKEKFISIKTNESLDFNEMRKIVESSILNAKNDIQQRMIIESKIKAKSFLNEIEFVKKDIELLCSKNDIEIIEKNINMLKSAIKTNDSDMINKHIEDLNKSTEKFAQRKINKEFSNFVGKGVDEIS